MKLRVFRYYALIPEIYGRYIAHLRTLVNSSVISPSIRRTALNEYDVSYMIGIDTDINASEIGSVKLRKPSRLYTFLM